jgi:hypothetical protein
MKTKLAILAAIAITAAGCRLNMVSNESVMNLTNLSGTTVTKADGALDGTQAADKKVGDIAPKANVAAGPLSKAVEAGSNADAGSTGGPVPQ